MDRLKEGRHTTDTRPAGPSAGPQTPPDLKDVMIPLAKYLGGRAVDFSRRAIVGRRQPKRSAFDDGSEEAEEQRLQEEERRREDEEAQRRKSLRGGSPWIYLAHTYASDDAQWGRTYHHHHHSIFGKRRTPRWVMWFQIALLLSLLALPVLAVEPQEVLSDPALESRARAISTEVRCLVCQNQTIDDSNAPLAADLRRLVRERVAAGDSDREVLTFLTDRYGDYVLLRPPVQGNTYVLWLAPVLVLAGGALVVLRSRRGRPTSSPSALEPPLSEAERAELARLLVPSPETGQRG